nr:acylsugar acyltransferase 3-like [Tanacetum cinerariifolium]
MTMISSLVRFGSRRKLHTIVSREIMKPSSPTPSHLKTYNLSMFDQLAPDAYVPLVIFYPNYSNIDLNSRLKLLDMKKSLSQTLTQYYPFAVQVNQFACGGIAVAVSLSHKIADGSSLCNFFNDWAVMTRLRSWEQNYV